MEKDDNNKTCRLFYNGYKLHSRLQNINSNSGIAL